MEILRADIYRLFHSKRLLFTLVLYILVIYFCNISDILLFQEFISVDTLIDSITESGWFREVLYVVSALPFSQCYCEDIRNHYFINVNTRTTITSYAHSKAFVTIFSTFLVSVAGFFIAIFMLSMQFPLYDPNAAYSLNITGTYGVLTLGHYPFLFFLVRVILFASGNTLWAMISLFVSSYHPDFFLTAAMPFISSYLIYRFVMNLPDILNIDYCISGYSVIEKTGLFFNFIYSIGYIWLLIFIAAIGFTRKLERSMK